MKFSLISLFFILKYFLGVIREMVEEDHHMSAKNSRLYQLLQTDLSTLFLFRLIDN